jgi:hypothetical protein
MPDYLTVLERASQSHNRPAVTEVVEALLTAEKTAKKSKEAHIFPELVGTWRLKFFTGTQKARQRTGIVLGAGRYVPDWVKVYISYSETAQISNSVKLGFFTLTITGPTKFLPPKNILAFEFLRINIFVWERLIYQGYMRGGEKSAAEFQEKGLQKQPFFAYFLIQRDKIAARGREGGLALWARENETREQ